MRSSNKHCVILSILSKNLVNRIPFRVEVSDEPHPAEHILSLFGFGLVTVAVETIIYGMCFT